MGAATATDVTATAEIANAVIVTAVIVTGSMTRSRTIASGTGRRTASAASVTGIASESLNAPGMMESSRSTAAAGAVAVEAAARSLSAEPAKGVAVLAGSL